MSDWWDASGSFVTYLTDTFSYCLYCMLEGSAVLIAASSLGLASYRKPSDLVRKVKRPSFQAKHFTEIRLLEYVKLELEKSKKAR